MRALVPRGPGGSDQKSHNCPTHLPHSVRIARFKKKLCVGIGRSPNNRMVGTGKHHEPCPDDVTPAASVGRGILSLVDVWSSCRVIGAGPVSSLHRRTGCVTCAQPYPLWESIAAHSHRPATFKPQHQRHDERRNLPSRADVARCFV